MANVHNFWIWMDYSFMVHAIIIASIRCVIVDLCVCMCVHFHTCMQILWVISFNVCIYVFVMQNSHCGCCSNFSHHSPGQTTAILDIPLHLLHPGDCILVCEWASIYLMYACRLSSVEFSMEYFTYLQLAPIVGLYFPESFLKVGKYVSLGIKL